MSWESIFNAQVPVKKETGNPSDVLLFNQFSNAKEGIMQDRIYSEAVFVILIYGASKTKQSQFLQSSLKLAILCLFIEYINT